MKDFGKGWMTANAQDLCKIMFVFGSLDPMDLIMELKHVRTRDRQLVNVRTIENAIARLRAK